MVGARTYKAIFVDAVTAGIAGSFIIRFIPPTSLLSTGLFVGAASAGGQVVADMLEGGGFISKV